MLFDAFTDLLPTRFVEYNVLCVIMFDVESLAIIVYTLIPSATSLVIIWLFCIVLSSDLNVNLIPTFSGVISSTDDAFLPLELPVVVMLLFNIEPSVILRAPIPIEKLPVTVRLLFIIFGFPTLYNSIAYPVLDVQFIMLESIVSMFTFPIMDCINIPYVKSCAVVFILLFVM